MQRAAQSLGVPASEAELAVYHSVCSCRGPDDDWEAGPPCRCRYKRRMTYEDGLASHRARSARSRGRRQNRPAIRSANGRRNSSGGGVRWKRQLSCILRPAMNALSADAGREYTERGNAKMFQVIPNCAAERARSERSTCNKVKLKKMPRAEQLAQFSQECDPSIGRTLQIASHSSCPKNGAVAPQFRAARKPRQLHAAPAPSSSQPLSAKILGKIMGRPRFQKSLLTD